MPASKPSIMLKQPSATRVLKRVHRLSITFLVDNSIEWMTKLPPGFTHELPQHIRQEPVDPSKGVPVLDFDKFCCGAHGFAALVETHAGGDSASHLTLFDTGPDSLSLVRNISAMQVPAGRVERVVTSHWHSDHTGGLLSFLQARQTQEPSAPCVVDVHPDRPLHRGIAPGPNYDKVVCALPLDPTFEQITEAGGKLEKHTEGHAVADEMIWVSGEIPRVTQWETGILGGMRWVENGQQDEAGREYGWVHEQHIMDERYAAIDVAGKGLVIFSSCSHAGIVNVVKDAVDTFSRPIYMIIGGLHLAGPEFSPRIQPTVEFLSDQLRPSPTYILPMHCTGFQAKIALEKEFGEGCVPAGVGHRIDIVGGPEQESMVFPPVY